MTAFWLVLFLLLATAIATPWAAQRLRCRSEAPIGRGIDLGSDLDRWTDSQLYAVWCATADELRRATQSGDAATAARARELLLAEIERRYPRRAAAWLSSNQALTGEPPQFLVEANT